ncbi:hypothetical protein PUN28_017042 [Cardiocondyla obscurior]|uniref:Uncharacterized protein n=1 Tax=Cardiocondyla obscurior TaxID=286306 RepID=A0AAW2ELN3_9HYME
MRLLYLLLIFVVIFMTLYESKADAISEADPGRIIKIVFILLYIHILTCFFLFCLYYNSVVYSRGDHYHSE